MTPADACAADACAADALAVLTAWAPPDRQQRRMRDRFVGFLDEHGAAAVDRDLRVGHLTASTVLLDASAEQVLLTLHPLIGQWVQLGGHVEPGETSMAQVAARETQEESGIAGALLDPVPIGLDWHAVTCRNGSGGRGPSSHLDVTYAAVAPPGAAAVRSDESLDLAWFPVDALPEGADTVTHRLVAEAVRRVGA